MAMTLRTDEELENALDDLTAAKGLSRQEVVRRAVLEMRDRDGHRARVADASRQMLADWGETLDRLGSV
ncbi:ribbon-helix-helix protein, CopG family [Nocardioides lianchengensis]|uniref:Ribbon-helix-helix protein, copG family n=1 Tax=Nocardioides lianchengensis TaxID=1045774 RepID=A0A1G6V8B7_9ACTN|nr:ribbon-helix-helix protein, CopG family [Nocardioides lianchengensis]NYG11185.1 putative transcriptional regulator [Nocardioides lianchengensis]SDD49919.1 Ribbon-helix-helix protein, copG family [Nocardioides lianchengensis]